MPLSDIYFDKPIPGLFGKINAIRKFWSNPCDAPWVVYLELAAPPVGHLALGLLGISMTDVVRSYARPRKALARSHVRNKRGKKKSVVGLPEPSDLVAEYLPGYEQAQGRQVSDGVKFLWIIDGVIQRGLWYWLILDLLTDSLFIWSSLINETEYCQEKDTARAFASSDNIATVLPLQGWVGAGPLDQNWAYRDCKWTHSTISIPSGRFNLIFGGFWRSSLHGAALVQLRWIDRGDPDTPPVYSDPVQLQVNEGRDFIHTVEWKGPAEVSIEIATNFATVEGGDGYALVRKVSN